MNVTHIRAENYRSWRSLDLDLPPGVTAITGPNGAGKTSLLSVIDTALFGAQGSLRDYLSDGETTLLVEVEFEHGGETYRVRRSYTAKSGGKTTLDLDMAIWANRLSPDATLAWITQTCETQKATQERINTLIGLTPATWESSAYLRQGGGSWADPSIPPRQRKEMLAQALGLDQWDRMLVLARADRVGVESERSKVGGQIETLAAAAASETEAQATLSAARLERDAARQRLTEMRTACEGDAENIRRATGIAEQRQRAVIDLDQARTRQARAVDGIALASERIADIERAIATRGTLEQHAAGLADLEQAYHAAATSAASRLAEIETWKAERGRLLHERDWNADEATRAAATIERLEADQARYRGQIDTTRNQPDATCHACGQELHDAARAKAVEGLEETLRSLVDETRHWSATATRTEIARLAAVEAINALSEPARSDPAVVAAADTAVQKARLAANELAAISAREERLPELQAAIQHATTDAAEAAGQVAAAEKVLAETAQVDLDKLKATLAADQRLADEAQRAVSEAEQRIGHADARLAQAIAARHQVDVLNAAAAGLDSDLAALDACIAAYGPGGIPALILETSAIPQIEAEANRVLAELGTEFRVELATQRAKRSSDGLIETLDVLVHSSQGVRSFELFSGGERTRVNLALRLSLAQLLAHRRGADVRVFLVDEPEGLDAAGMDAFSRVLKRVETTFERILVVSHHVDLRDSFDSVLEVERDGSGVSSLAGQVEAVVS